MQDFTYSGEGLALTESFEGVRLTAYRDMKGVLTIGYGHTGPDVFVGMVITEEQAEDLLMDDVQAASAAVNRLVTLEEMTQEEFDAMVDFTFNCGIRAFAGSTLLKDVNAGRLEAAASQFEQWDKCAGQVVAGLLRRRMAEETMFRKHG